MSHPAAQAEATDRDCVVLATFPRGRPGAEEELRVVADSFNGHFYLSIRKFYRGSDGNWYPSKAGVTVKAAEARAFLEAAARGLQMAAEASQDRTGRPRGDDGGRASGRRREPGRHSDDRGEFNEFSN